MQGLAALLPRRGDTPMSTERALREALHDLADVWSERADRVAAIPRENLDREQVRANIETSRTFRDCVAQLRPLAGDDTRAETKAAEEAAARPLRLSDLLLLVGFKVPHYHVSIWKPEHQAAAEQWASLVHLAASDNDVTIPDRPGFLVRYTEEYRDQEAHQCHFCGTYVLAGYESNGDRHWLSDCRRDLVKHEIDPKVCTWGYLLLPENSDLGSPGQPACYAYQNRDYPPKMSPNDPARWTNEHVHFDEDGPM